MDVIVTDKQPAEKVPDFVDGRRAAHVEEYYGRWAL